MKRMIFVYNSKGGALSSAFDLVHKVVSPKTYKCNLCKLTYGSLSMKKSWKDFIDKLNFEVIFLHKDYFSKKYGLEEDLPAVFLEDGSKLKVLVNSKEIESCKNLDELKDLVGKKVTANTLGLNKI